MPPAGNDASTDNDHDDAKGGEGLQDSGRRESIKELEKTVTKEEKLDEPQPIPVEADEFGLPARQLRRREYSISLSELDTPDEIARKVVEETGGVVDASGLEKVEEDPAAADAKKEDEKQAENEDEKFSTPRTSLDHDNDKDKEEPTSPVSTRSMKSPITRHQKGKASVSEWSHQQMAPQPEPQEDDKSDEGEWQDMPALATHRIYDDWGKVIAKEYSEVEDQTVAYGKLGGAGKGYTRVQVDEDAQSATSMDENTAYLFKEPASNALDEEDDSRDMQSQMQATKELLTEGQRIAYVGIVRLSLVEMAKELDQLDKSKHAKKAVEFAIEAQKMWSQKIMVKLYTHMEIDAREQIMVEQLAEHGVIPADLTPTLMQNARVKNPTAAAAGDAAGAREASPQSGSRPTSSATTGTDLDSLEQERPESSPHEKSASTSPPTTPIGEAPPPPPAYQDQHADDFTVRDVQDLNQEKSIDIDLRWTVLCDLFLLLISDSAYDSRSRTLLENVGAALSVDWQEICRFEKRVTDALEVQEQAEKENWNEDEHLEARRKAALRKRYVVMGLCTVGGGLVIGLSSGLLAPVIGAGLAAGFTGIGVAGTGTFLGSAGAAALIGTTGTLIGGRVGLKTSSRRTGAVKTFEYKPLYNNKRVNLIVTVAGWMTGKVDDVRLPFSTVDPIMGDIYSVNWEPDMLQSTGATIQILATEALTQTIQQILGATMLATLMAGISPPIVLLKISYLIDNPWTVSLARADATGLILADSLIDRNLGMRPVTLVGFSLGSRVIFSCLKELARRGAIGLVQNVYMFGSPVVAKKEDWTRARTVVSGRFVNGYATNDWILGYLFRATSGGIRRVAGLSGVEVTGIDNRDITEWVPGHMAYRGMMPILLDQVGWKVDSLEFSEIEDPDPDNHETRQRELITEIEEARKQMDEQPEKKGFKSFFSRKKAAQKKAWETYDERSARVLEGDEKESERVVEENANANVLFDVDAIRKEALALALQHPGEVEDIKAHLSVREIQSTMPALRITTMPVASASGSGRDNNDSPGSAVSTPGSTARPDLRPTRSATMPWTPTAPAAASSTGSLQLPKQRLNAALAAPSAGGEDDGITMSFDEDRPHTHTNLAAPSPTITRAASYNRSLDIPDAESASSHYSATTQKQTQTPPLVSRESSRSPAFGNAAAGGRSVSSPLPGNSNSNIKGYRNGFEDQKEEEEEVEMSFE